MKLRYLKVFFICGIKVIFCFRPYWRCYYANTDAVIYVVDSADRDRIGISKQELLSMLEVSENRSSCLLLSVVNTAIIASFVS